MKNEDKSQPVIVPPAEAMGDPWAEWQPRWTGKISAEKQRPTKDKIAVKDKTLHDLQEKHSPTESVSVRLTAERSVQKNRRRIVDNRLWEAMSPAQQNAALQIALAFELMGKGLGYVNSNWERIPGCRGQSNVSESHARLIQNYTEWTTSSAKNKIAHSLIVDILCFGHSCRTVDHDRRIKNGSTRVNLMNGLTLYCAQMGWEV